MQDIDVSKLCHRRLSAGRHFSSVLIIVFSVLACSVANSDNRQASIDSLRPTPEHQQSTEVIVHLMQRYHYKPVQVDDELSEQIFDRFLETLAQWVESRKAMDELWRKRVKNDVLNLRLVEQGDDELIDTLDKRYTRMARRVSQLSANDVYQFFINAYTQSVEPHTSYFSPRSSENFNINMSLSLEGIGTALQTDNEYTVVRRVIAGGPAALSEQISVDDRIVGVGDGKKGEIVDIVSWPLNDVVDLIRGPKGSTVRLHILPVGAPAGSQPELITLVRDKIKLEEQAAKRSVVEVPVGESTRRIGVIDLPTFYLDSAAQAQGQQDYRSTTRDVQRLLGELVSSEGGVDGIIVDLRGNGGGSLIEATQLTGLFIEDGPIVQIREATGEVSALDDDDPTIVYDGPLAVLVDRSSASASEIFAAAIQDYGRGVVLGEPTFGKGTVQRVVPLDRDGKLGVVPDILFPTAIDSVAQGERGLDNALEWAEVSAANYNQWSDRKPNYEQLQSEHEARYRSSDWFAVLIDELKSQRADREQQQVSLVESIREKENLERGSDREERLQLFRKAFGASGNDNDSENDEKDVPDIILDEAANVLLNIMDSSP